MARKPAHMSHGVWLFFFLGGFAGLASLNPNAVLAERISVSTSLDARKVELKGAGAAREISVNEEGYVRLSDEALPELPYRIVTVLLPQGDEVKAFHVESSEPVGLGKKAELRIAPPMIAEDGGVGRGVPLAEFSEDGTVFPANRVKFLGTSYLHGRAIATFAVFPLRLEGGNLFLTETLTLSIDTGPGNADVVVRKRYRDGFQSNVNRLLSSIVVNPEMTDRYRFDEVRVKSARRGFQPTEFPSLEGSDVDYVIITRSDLVAEFQRLADWKTAKGVPTVVRTIEWILANYRNGVDPQETIRFFVRDAYAKWGITYALLGGDTDVLPPRYAYSKFYGGGVQLPVDMYFGCLDGSWNDTHDRLWGEGFNIVPMDNPDLYAEVYTGRIPCSTPGEVKTLVDKIKTYERAVQRDYMNKVLLLGEVLFPKPWKPGDPISINGADLQEFVYLTSMVTEPLNVVRSYQTNWDSIYPGSVPESRAATINYMNSGFNHINHVGHGFRYNLSVADGSVITSDADNLTNFNRWFNLYMLNCTAAAFDYACLGEHFLKNPNGGAVSVVGANNSAFPTPSATYMNEYFKLVMKDDVVHVGEAFARSRLPRTPEATMGDNVHLWTHYIYTFLGEPEMALFNGPVDTANVVHVTNVGLGPNNILVNVTAGGLPVDSAVVCLSKGTEDYQVAVTNSLGTAIIGFTTETPGSISVVVTGLNIARKTSYITVNPSGSAYVNYSGLTVDDDSVGSTYGNGDGVIDAGETVGFTLNLINTGGAPSDSVWFVMRTNSAFATVLDSVAGVGIIGAGQTKTALAPLRVAFGSGTTDESAAKFTLEIHNGLPAAWTDSFKKLVHAPKLSLIKLRINDSAPLGDGNGQNSANEEFKLHYKVKNFGTGTAYGLTAAVQDLSGAFVVTTSADTYADLAPLASGENISGFHLKETDVSIEHDLRVTITDLYGRVYADTIELRRPNPPSGLEFNASLGVDRIQVAWLKSTSTDVTHYNVYHSLTSGGPYTLASVDPVEHAVFVDTGLLPSTRYYFVVRAVDKSGNESVSSAEFFASTNPPQIAGFPVQMKRSTVSSPAIGDLDGDGQLEIVVGDQYVYAWHGDGLEMRDGDGDPQTWGILVATGDEFVAPVTLANLNGSPGMEIIASSYNTKQTFIFDHNGSNLPGWPRTTENKVRAGAVVGDLDGDGILEIVAVDEQSVIYAWRINGTEFRDGDNNPATQGVFFRTPSALAPQYHTPAMADIDGDGRAEIINAGRMSKVYALNGDGTNVPGWPVTTSGEVRGSVAVGDVDNDGFLEVVVHVATSEVLLLNHDGTLSAGWPRFVALNNFFAPSPALADFNGDGKLEVLVTGSGGKLYVINSLGQNLAGWPVTYSTTTYTESSPVVADIDGDGSMDVILGDESRFINAWGVSGTLKSGFPIATGDAVRGTPALADVDGDGDIDMAVAGWDLNMYVWDLSGTYNKNLAHWPTFHGNIHRNGLFGYTVPTAIGNVAFSYLLGGGQVSLKWMLPTSTAFKFDILRSRVDGNSAAGYVPVATGLAPSVEGFVEYNDRNVEMGQRYIYKLVSLDNPEDAFTSDVIYIPVSRFELHQNHPNPFNPTTTITYFVPEGDVRPLSLVIYDVSGARVKTLVEGVRRPGRHSEIWNGTDDRGNVVGSGIYFYRLKSEGYGSTKKMLLLK